MTHKTFTSFARLLLLLAPFSLLTACSSDVQGELPTASVAPTASRSVDVRVRASSDDAEEKLDGLMRLTGTDDLELGMEAGKLQAVGLRFNRVDVPRGATITRAYIQFTADETSSVSTRVSIHGQASNNVPTFKNTTRNITTRTKTSRAVVWNPAPWTRVGAAGTAQRTPDLSAVVQQITNRAGWASGNALAVVITGKYGVRAAESFNGNPSAAPRLHVEYEDGPQILSGQGVRIILDTDLGIDVDDAGALAVLHALADKGEANILATVANVNDPYAPGALDAINTYYGRPNIPVGRNSRQQYSVATPYWRNPAPRFLKDLALTFPNDTSTSSLKTAVSVYRKALATQPDGSVTIVSVGFLQNLADLIASSSDSYSSLSGMELIKRKVKHLVLMGGSYPSSKGDLYLAGGRDIDPPPAIRVLEDWPTTIAFTPGNVCGGFTTGQTLASKTPQSNPVRAAYRLFFGREGVGRSSWDLCPVLYAVRGLSNSNDGTYFGIATTERLVLQESGQHGWTAPGEPRHKRLTRVMSESALQTKLEALLVKPPSQ